MSNFHVFLFLLPLLFFLLLLLFLLPFVSFVPGQVPFGKFQLYLAELQEKWYLPNTYKKCRMP